MVRKILLFMLILSMSVVFGCSFKDDGSSVCPAIAGSIINVETGECRVGPVACPPVGFVEYDKDKHTCNCDISEDCFNKDDNFEEPKYPDNRKFCRTADDCTNFNEKCDGCSCGEGFNKEYVEEFQRQNPGICDDYEGPWCELSCQSYVLNCINNTCIKESE